MHEHSMWSAARVQLAPSAGSVALQGSRGPAVPLLRGGTDHASRMGPTIVAKLRPSSPRTDPSPGCNPGGLTRSAIKTSAQAPLRQAERADLRPSSTRRGARAALVSGFMLQARLPYSAGTVPAQMHPSCKNHFCGRDMLDGDPSYSRWGYRLAPGHSAFAVTGLIAREPRASKKAMLIEGRSQPRLGSQQSVVSESESDRWARARSWHPRSQP